MERAASGELAGGLGLERVQARALNNRATMSERRILVVHALDALGSPSQSDAELSADRVGAASRIAVRSSAGQDWRAEKPWRSELHRFRHVGSG